MCGGFSIRLNPWNINFLDVKQNKINWQPIYNARPGEWLPIITEERPYTITTAFWGFTPSWATKPGIKPVINAKAETLTEKPYFRTAFQQQRCVIPADGFFEWLPKGGVRVPYYFHRKDEKPFLFAGLYSRLPGYKDKEGFAIITTNPNSLVERIHNRMPVILDDRQEGVWLDPAAKNENLQAILGPYPEDLMAMRQVSQKVNSAKEKGAEVISPITT